MPEPFTRLPDVDSIKGMSITGEIVEIEYQRSAGDEHYVLSMTLPNAHYLLVLLSQLPDADRILERARQFQARGPSG